MNVCVRNKISVDLPADYRTVLITAGIRESDERILKRILEERIISLYRGIVFLARRENTDALMMCRRVKLLIN